MTKKTVQFQCNECGFLTSKWSGRCQNCQAWNGLTELAIPAANSQARQRQDSPALYRLDSLPREAPPCQSTGIREFDRVLGGGIVNGSVTLLGGNPGIGKSTLLLQVLVELKRQGHDNTLYVSAEESAQQIGLRAHRLDRSLEGLRLLADNHLENILRIADQEQASVMVVDSIQTLYSEQLPAVPGAVGQVRECAAQLVRFAKQGNTAIYLIGHVTKEGALAGPRMLEHMVDTVLYFEGDSSSRYRIIRAVKNRFGAINELGIFAMTERGLKEVHNPSAIFLSRHTNTVAGSVVMATLEGTRPLLLEVQALVDRGQSKESRRVSVGLDQNRLIMLLAVLHRHAGIDTSAQDIYVNIVGGVRVAETGADLAVLLAVSSSLQDHILPRDLLVFGELGLSGEIRPVANGLERLNEAAKHGFRHAIIPAANMPKKAMSKGLHIIAVQDLPAALAAVRELTGDKGTLNE